MIISDNYLSILEKLFIMYKSISNDFNGIKVINIIDWLLKKR